MLQPENGGWPFVGANGRAQWQSAQDFSRPAPCHFNCFVRTQISKNKNTLESIDGKELKQVQRIFANHKPFGKHKKVLEDHESCQLKAGIDKAEILQLLDRGEEISVELSQLFDDSVFATRMEKMFVVGLECTVSTQASN